MTLTQTIVAPWGIWQCSDYLLTEPKTGTIIEQWSQKHVNVFCNDGLALITYSGVARFKHDSADVSDWLADQLNGFAVTISSTVRRIEEVASQHLSKYQTPHIFTVAALINDEPWAIEVANVKLGVDWFDLNPEKSFRTYGERMTDKPLLLVRGLREAISAADWKLLHRETQVRPRHAKRFVKLLAGVNKRAHDHTQFGKYISRECGVDYTVPGIQGVRGKSFEWGNKDIPWRMAAPATLTLGLNMTAVARSSIVSLQEEVRKNEMKNQRSGKFSAE